MEEAPAALPDDAIAEVLRRLPTRTIAMSRCVCKAWRAVVDDRGLLLPRALRGIFINLLDYECPRFFARPSSEERPGGNLGFLPGYRGSYGSILDHCNGLLLYDGGYFEGKLYVVNPATRRWDCLPPRTEDDRRYPRWDLKHYVAYLTFDPAVSPHYEVVLIPRIPKKPMTRLPEILRSVKKQSMEESSEEDPYRLMIWPPSPYTFHVFSSRTGCWEERPFIREGDAVGTVEDVRLGLAWTISGPRCGYGVYWRGTLYVQCSDAFVIRISLTNGTYQVIKTPTSTKEIHDHTSAHLGRSEEGVYFVTIENGTQLQIWILRESSHGQVTWVLKHDHIDIVPYLSRVTGQRSSYHALVDGPWYLEEEEDDFSEPTEDEDDYDAEMLENDDDDEWNSDEDIALDGEVVEEPDIYNIAFLGFHPYNEIIFLATSFIAVAYNLTTSKVQYLGKFWPENYAFSVFLGVYESFPYTPCMSGDHLQNPSS